MNGKFLTKIPKMLHGADYNPEQWLNHPEILEKDIEYMKKANINCVSVGIFSWVTLEPEEGRFNFEWLDNVIESLYSNGIYTVLATPTGAKPAWMAQKYPEIMRVAKNGTRDRQNGRHNHCYNSPVYREKTRIINTLLAERYANNPAVILWHISNEIQGECYCPICCEKFREWLKNKYKTLDALNEAWWTCFWSHTYTDWSQIEPPFENGESNIHGLVLDWKRFCTDSQVDFCAEEIKPLKAQNPDIPVTINMMGYYDGINYYKFKDILDVISWDAYPSWHNGDGNDETGNAMWCASFHDIMRSMKQQPFLLMESTPSTTNWQGVSRHKKPNLHKTASLQAIAHGSDSVQYFQWRASRGSCEKFHSAVINHDGTDKTRIFRQVADVGQMLSGLGEVCASSVNAKIAFVIDTENIWALQNTKGPLNDGIGYFDIYFSAYRALWLKGYACDVIDCECDFSKYDLLIVPMLYMLRGGVEKKLIDFAKSGGKSVVCTYFTGIADENDLCFLGQTPAGGLSELLGIVQDDIDALYDHQSNEIVIENAEYGLSGAYKAHKLCQLITPTTAKVLGRYSSDFYADTPALTVNEFCGSKAFYIAADVGFEFFDAFLPDLCKKADIKPAIGTEIPYGVSVTKREGENDEFIFFMNFTNEKKSVDLDFSGTNLLDGTCASDILELEPFGCAVLKKTQQISEQTL